MSTVGILRSEFELQNQIKEKEIEELKKSLEFACGLIDDQKKIIEDLKKSYKDVRKEVDALKIDLKEVKDNAAKDHERLIYVDDYGRRNSLRFRGIPEDPRENWEQTQMKVVRLLNTRLGINPEIERAHRLGNKKPGHSREVIVKFLKYPDKEFILNNRNRLAEEEISFAKIFAIIP